MNQTSLVGRPLFQLGAALSRFASGEKRTSGWSGPLTSSSPELARLWASPASGTGMNVNAETVLTYSVFWACIRNISEDVASLPLVLYKEDDRGGKTPLRNSKLYELLHDEPNPRTDSMTFRQTLTAHVMTWGNAYAEIQRDALGRVVALWQITPDRVTLRRDPNGNDWYQVSNPDGGTVRLNPENMFHIAGYGYDGTCGYSIVEKARESVGLGMATERFGGTFFGNGATFGGVFEHPGRMSEQALKNFRESVNTQHQGVDKAHKFMVVEENMKYQAFGVPPNVAQFLETRQFQVEEICRWFRMPPHMVQHLLRTSYNSIEHQRIEYSVDTIRPWCVRWENAIRRQLVPRLERFVQKVEHNMDGIQRGDQGSRYTAWATARQWGFMSVNEIRAKENMNPLPGDQGDSYLVPQNMVPADRVDEVIDKQVAPDPIPVAPAPAAKSDEGDRSDKIIAELREELATVRANLAEQMAQLQTTTAASLRFDQFPDLFEPHIAALSGQIAENQKHEGALQALLLEATRRADRAEAEREAKRLEAEEAAQKAAAELEAARLDAEAKHAAMADQVTVQIAEMTERVQEVSAQRDAVMAARQEAVAEASDAERLAREARAEVEAAKSQHEAELAALQAQLLAAEARALQAEAERTKGIDEVNAKVAERAAAEEAVRVAAQAAEQQAAKDAEAARQLLEEEAARVTAEREAHAATKAALETVSAAVTAASTAADAANLAAAQALDEATAIRTAAEKVAADHAAQLQAEQAARAALDVQIQAQRQAHEQQLEAIRLAQRESIIDAAGRMVRVEVDRARRNQGSPAKLRAWAEAFYMQQEDRWVEALRADMRAVLVTNGVTEDVDTYTRSLIAPQLLAAVQQIRTVADGDPEDFSASLERLLTKWEKDRPLAIGDRVFLRR